MDEQDRVARIEALSEEYRQLEKQRSELAKRMAQIEQERSNLRTEQRYASFKTGAKS